MSSIYVLPIDPSAPTVTAAPVGATELWTSTPAANAPKPSKAGTTHLFYGENVTAVSSLGDKFGQKRGDERREVVRKTIGSAIKKVRELGEAVEGSKVVVDASADPHAAAVAAHLALYHFTLKTKPTSAFDPRLAQPLPDKPALSALSENNEWETGVVYGQAQNLARTVRVSTR